MIDRFSAFVEGKARKTGRKVTRCSFDGQDSIVGADYLFTNNTNFFMVEFKYDKSDLKKEKRKVRRLKLCYMLDEHEDWKNLSKACHYVAWSEEIMKAVADRYRLNFNAYYDEICNRHVFGEDSGLEQYDPFTDFRVSAGRLADDFLAGNLGVGFELFEQYTDWLLSLEDEAATGIELMVDDGNEDELILLGFSSVRGLKEWLDTTTFEPPKPSSRPSGGPSFG